MRRPIAPIRHFLLVFDHDAGMLVETRDFGRDADRAVEAYTEKEREFADRPRVEVVLIGSDSLDTIRRTHANYFSDSPALFHYLKAAGLE